MRILRALGLAVPSALLVACSGGGDGSAAPAPPSTTVATAAPCPAVDLPAGTTDSVTVGGDFDGDARADRLLTYRVASSGPWRVRVELGRGGAIETDLPATAAGVRALGGFRLDPSTAETAVVIVGSNPPGVNIGLFSAGSCRLQRVTVGGAPTELVVRSTPTERGGLVCQAPGLLVHRATSADGRTFAVSSVGYLLVGTVLDEVHRSTSTLGVEDPSLAPVGAFSCGGLRL